MRPRLEAGRAVWTTGATFEAGPAPKCCRIACDGRTLRVVIDFELAAAPQAPCLPQPFPAPLGAPLGIPAMLSASGPLENMSISLP